MADQLVNGDFDAWLKVTTLLGEADEETKTSVYTAARPLAEARVQEARACGDGKQIERALSSLAHIAHDLKDYEAARVAIAESLDYRDKADPFACIGFSVAGNMLQEQGDLITARKYMEEAVSLARTRATIQACIADALFGLGCVTGAQGEMDTAGRCFAESIARRRAWQQESPNSDNAWHIFMSSWSTRHFL